MLSIQINEVYPNPESGNEWVELRLINDTNTTVNLLGYSLSDNNKQIYQFTEFDNATQEFLVIEVSGLNNDQDSVILKNETGAIIDSFSYTNTQKGLSWSRTTHQGFVLEQISKGTANPTPTPSSTATPSQSPSIVITTAPTQASPSPSPGQENLNANHSPGNNPTTTRPIKLQNYPIEQIRLQATNKHSVAYASRLVLIGDRSNQGQLQNAIMGSLLLLAGGAGLLYVKVKNAKKHA